MSVGRRATATKKSITMASFDGNHLSASASTFVPGGSSQQPPQREDFTQDEVDYDIEDEMHEDDMNDLIAGMNDSSVASAAVAAASTTLPAHLASQAAEFWFPECRDCVCCKGYKHGCSCGGLCKCSGGPTSGEATSLGAASAPQTTYNTKQQGKKMPCRFFQSGSCKFGDKCRFSHE